MAERRTTFDERPTKIPEVGEEKGYPKESVPSKSERVMRSQAESAFPGTRPSLNDRVSNSREDRTDAIVGESQAPRFAGPKTNSISFELNEEDLGILVRHICRAAGTVTVKLLAEFFPGIDSKTSLGFISRLIESQLLRRSQHGCFRFVDPTGDIETGQLERERKVLERVKDKIIEGMRPKSSTGVLHPRQEKRSSKEISDSGETDEIRATESHSSALNYRFSDAEMGIALGTERKASQPKLAEPVKESKSISFNQETNAPKVSENAKPLVITVSPSGEEFQEVSSTEMAQTIPSVHGTDTSHRNRIRETEIETRNPCRMLEVVCENMGFRPPAYTITFMPIDRIFYSLLFVAGSSFPSHPTVAVDEKAAKEAAAEKALQGFGITSEMVATRNFTYAKFPMQRIQRNLSGAYASEP